MEKKNHRKKHTQGKKPIGKKQKNHIGRKKLLEKKNYCTKETY